MNGADASADDPISGVPLAQYAAVTAALAAAYPLKAVLSAEGIDAPRWAKADAGWTARLDADASLLAKYEEALAAAADRLERTVEPIDADVGAWAAFLAELARGAEAPLQQHGITHDDVARLRRAWDVRTAADPELRRRLAELRQNPGPLPALRVVKAKLRSSGAAASPAALPADPAAHVNMPTAAAIAQSQPVIAIAARTPALRPALEQSTIEAPVPSVSPPFRPAASRAFLDALPARAARPGDGSDGETVDVRLPVEGAPFEVDDESTVVLSPALELATPVDESTVALSSPLPVARALPFREGRAAAAVAVPRMPVARPLGQPPPPPRSDLPRVTYEEGALPKLYDEPVVETKTINHVPNAGSALPFAPAREAGSPSTEAPHAPAESPSLTLDQHAALCLEIAVDPTRAEEALGRFHVTAADKAHLDEVYRARFSADPGLRAQWNTAFETHRRWLASRPR